MKRGDRVLFYHSNANPPGIVGTATVVRESYPDAQLLQDRIRIATTRWPAPDRLPGKVRELARRVEEYYESGENSKEPVL